jgi:hypothetical protein
MLNCQQGYSSSIEEYLVVIQGMFWGAWIYSCIKLQVETSKRQTSAKTPPGIPCMDNLKVGSEVLSVHDVDMAMH